MVRFIIVGLLSGILFWLLDAIINGLPFAQKLYQVYKPILRTTMNIPLGFLIYVILGFAMAGMFLFLSHSLPGQTGIMKGMSFALVAWFFRCFMAVIGQWMMFPIPSKALVYSTITGMFESLVLGILYGLTLRI
jgi:hypothetical protein